MTAGGNPLLVQRSSLGRLDRLGEGGTALIYRCPELQVPGLPDVAYKEYKDKILVSAGPSLLSGLLRLAQFRDGLNDKQRGIWDRKVVWPLRVVVDDAGRAVGILMKLIPSEYFIGVRTISGATERNPAEIDMVLGDDQDAQRFNFPTPSMTSRLTLCTQILGTYELVHRNELIVGDVSPRNLVFTDGALGPRVLLIDCDSYRLRGKRAAFGDQPHTPSWEPPESVEADHRLQALRKTSASSSQLSTLRAQMLTQSERTDVYKIGLLIVRVLDHGRNRSRNRNPAKALAILERQMNRTKADMLRRALDPDPAARPTLRAWREVWLDKQAPPQPRQTHPSLPPPQPRQTHPSVPPPPPPPLSRGNWDWVDGEGWTRRAHGAIGGQP